MLLPSLPIQTFIASNAISGVSKQKKKVKMAKPDSMQNFHHKKCLRQNIAYGKNVFGEKKPFLKILIT